MSGMWVSALIGLVNTLTFLLIIYLTPEGDRHAAKKARDPLSRR